MLAVAGSMLGGWLLAVDLRWSAPDRCPSAAAVRDHVTRLLDEGGSPSPVVIDARVEGRAEGWVVRLSLRDGVRSSARTITARDCETLAHAVALIAATFAEPLAVTARLGPTTPAGDEAGGTALRPGGIRSPAVKDTLAGAASPLPPEPLPPAPASPSRAGPSVAPVVSPQIGASDTAGRGSAGRRPSARTRPSDQLGVSLGLAVGRAAQHDLDVGPTAGLGWRRGAAGLSGTVVALVPRSRPVPERVGVTLSTWMLAVGVRGGVVVPLSRRLELPVALGVEIGPAVARGRGIARPRTVVSPWVAATGSACLVVRPTPRWGVELGVLGLVGLVLPQFAVDGSDPVAVGPGGIRAMVGVRRRWR